MAQTAMMAIISGTAGAGFVILRHGDWPAVAQTKSPPGPGDPAGFRPGRPAYFCCRLKLIVTVRMKPVGSPFRRSGW
jgi:hypothetical protein